MIRMIKNFKWIYFVLLCCHSSTSAQKSDSALTVVDDTEAAGGGNDHEARGDEEELEVLQPTQTWQTLQPGQAVPAGSHVRLNLQTGQREVRMGEEQLKYWNPEHEKTEESGGSLYSSDELKKIMKKIKEDLSPAEYTSHNQFRPLEELKKDMAQLDMLVETDVQILRRLLNHFNSSSTSTEQRLNILEELEYMVHQVDNAQSLCMMGGLQLILNCLNSSDSRLQEYSAFVLGSALASNPAVQVKAMESGALTSLLTALATAHPFSVKKKVLFAVASLLRHFPYAQQHFLSHGGLQVMSTVFRADSRGPLRARIITIIHDMIREKELVSQELESHQQERIRQYSGVSLLELLLEEGWCSVVPQLLESPEHDHREKALHTLLAMSPACLAVYQSDMGLQERLLMLRLQYQDKTPVEPSYFAELTDLIDELQKKL
ncbi:nucleotide exchange factor SIL1 [Synchiropus splendidus]|uniref:nucleotide exchange factor SIL1 n=1 Tax=Synchiropus splendidus TaxID=270530 RepID=UPI00237EC806|nr:nucleotide exchange factor SIL1 [Synchiropus splendidus]